MKRKKRENNRSVVFKRLEGTEDATYVQDCNISNNTININIEIDREGLAGYEFFVDGKSILWESMDRKQQVLTLNSFIQGYKLFNKFLKRE